MSGRNINMRKIRLLMVTTLCLFVSVAQSDETQIHGNDFARNGVPDRGFDLDFPTGLAGITETVPDEDPSVSLAVAKANGLGEMSIVQLHTGDSTRLHFNFRSGLTNEVISATLLSNGALSYDLPSGQILLENDIISIITPTEFAQLSLSDGQTQDLINSHFATLLNDLLHESDTQGFNLSLAESFAEQDLLSLLLIEKAEFKGSDAHTESMSMCGAALRALQKANDSLASAITGSYSSKTARLIAISIAIVEVGFAAHMVAMYCTAM